MSLGMFAALGVALAVIGVVVTAVYRRPQRGLLILAALTPMNGLVAIAPVAGLNGWKEALLVLTGICAWLRGCRCATPRLAAPWWPAALILVVFGSVSALVVYGPIGVFAIKVTFFYIAVVVVLWLAPFDARDRDRLVSIIMAAAVITAFVGILQQIVGPGVLVQMGYEYGKAVRTTGGFFRTFGTFNQPFPFGLYLTMALLVGGAVALAEPRRRRNALFLCVAPVLTLAMVTSVVRASILGLIVGVVWLVVIRFRAGIVPLLLTAATVVACLPLLPAGASKVLFSSSSLNERNTGWARIMDSIYVHPLGQGLGSSGSAADKMALASGQKLGLISPFYQPDNYYVKILLELGVIGLWALLVLLITALIWTVRLSWVLPGRDGAFALGVSASIVGVMVASLVSSYFEIFPLDFYFWLLLGVVGCSVTQNESPSGRLRSGPAEVESRPTSASC